MTDLSSQLRSFEKLPAGYLWGSFFGVAFLCSLETFFLHSFLVADQGEILGFLEIAALNALTVLTAILTITFFLKRSENKVIESRIDTRINHYLQAMELSREGICVTTPRGKITYANDAFCKNHGYNSPEEIQGKSWESFFTFEGDDWSVNLISPELKKNQKWTGQIKAIRKDNTLIDVDLKVIQANNKAFICMARDISEEMQSESLSQARLAAIEASKDGIGITNERGILIFINKALMNLHGIDETERDRYIGRHWENLYTKKGRKFIKDNVMPAYERYTSWSGEAPIEKLNGGHVFAELMLTKLPDGGMIGTARDISQKKQNELEKAQLREQFYQAQKMEAIGRMAGGMAHDFNNILAAIMGYSDFLLEDLDKKSEQYGFAENIHSAGLQARDLIDHMLAFSRRSETSHEIIDITDPVTETFKILGASLPRSIELKKEIDIPHPFVKGNATQIGQILMNLCVNSKDAMEEDQGILKLGLRQWDPEDQKIQELISDKATDPTSVTPTHITTPEKDSIQLMTGRLSRNEEYAVLSVKDTGSGISKSVAEHIFEPFYTTKAVNKGTGLGMSMVHGVVIEHKGAIVMESTLGKGTSFELFFPLALNPSDFEQTEKGNEPETIKGTGKILIVDDQEAVLHMLEKMLVRLGYNPVIKSNPHDALAILENKTEEFELVISDHTMPGMTGIALAQKVAETDPYLPFILISGYSQKKLDTAAETSVNIKGVLRKPINGQSLSSLISDVLKNAKTLESVQG